jgi:activator of HSP90 ATPase
MNPVIEQTIIFPNTTPAELFDIFLDKKKHSAILDDSKAEVSRKEGEKFSLLDGNLKGKNLLIVPDRMIVQSWKGNVWRKDDLDSILTLTFTAVKGGAQIYMVHANTPDQFTELWDEIYWQPIKEYLKQQRTK